MDGEGLSKRVLEIGTKKFIVCVPMYEDTVIELVQVLAHHKEKQLGMEGSHTVTKLQLVLIIL